MEKDYYKVLELEPGCTIDDIKDAYRRLAKKYHPDLNKSPNASDHFIEINEAYEVLTFRLSNPQYDKTNVYSQQKEYEEFIRKVREAAQRRARMKYEKFKKEHEAFQESGLYDIVLLLKYIGLVILPVLATALIIFPIVMAVTSGEVAVFFYLFYFWIIGLFLMYFIIQQGKDYFKLGKFYYSLEKISNLLSQKNKDSVEKCFYCKNQVADSIPYRLEIYKVKGVKLNNYGPMNHSAGIDRSVIKISIPRSQKALFVHLIATTVKLLCLFLSLIFLKIDSLIWRFVFGLFLGWIAAILISVVTNTRLKTGYLLSYGILIKIVFWIIPIILISKFYWEPFNIVTNEWNKLVIVLLAFADSFIEQVLKIPKHISLFKPILKSYRNLDQYFVHNYYLYLEIPVYTAIAPLLRWLF